MTGQRRKITCLLIDLDDTLYRVRDIPVMVTEHIKDYMVKKLGYTQDSVADTARELYYAYGTTMCGLVAAGTKIDYDDWHTHVHHALPYSQLLRPDPAMRALLQSVTLPKYIFTNADRKHAEICLKLMGLEDLFEGIVCFESIMADAQREGVLTPEKPVCCKPHKEAYELAMAAAGVDAEGVLFFDDSTRNINAAHAAGWMTVLVGQRGADCRADYQVPDLHKFPEAAPEVWESITDPSNLSGSFNTEVSERDRLEIEACALDTAIPVEV